MPTSSPTTKIAKSPLSYADRHRSLIKRTSTVSVQTEVAKNCVNGICVCDCEEEKPRLQVDIGCGAGVARLFRRDEECQTNFAQHVSRAVEVGETENADYSGFRWSSARSPVRVDGRLTAYPPSREDLERLDQFRSSTNRHSLDLFLEERFRAADTRTASVRQYANELERVQAELDEAKQQALAFRELAQYMMTKLRSVVSYSSSSLT